MRAHGLGTVALALMVIPIAYFAITFNNNNLGQTRTTGSSSSNSISISTSITPSSTTSTFIPSIPSITTITSTTTTSIEISDSRSTTTTTSSTTTSPSSFTTTTSSRSSSSEGRKQSLVYLAGVNYDQAVKDYSTREGITALGPQVYALDANGNVFLADGSFNPSSFATLAHSIGFKVIPLVMAGSGLCSGEQVWCNDNDILAIINNATQLQKFEGELVSLCQTFGFDGIQLDWETALNSSYQPIMTSALNSIANSLHAMSPSRSLSLTTYYWDYHAGPYDTWTLSLGSIDQLNVQAYTNNLGTFESEVSSMKQGMATISKLQVGMGDYNGVNSPIAGQCMQYILENGINSVAVWPNWGTELSFGSYGYSDSVYNTHNYYELLKYFLTN
jgi:hypothetical protein